MNSEPIRILAINHEDEMRDPLIGSTEALWTAMDCGVDNDRAQVSEPEITQIDFQGNMVHIQYQFDWFVYYGCDDMEVQDTVKNTSTGTLVDGYWVFQRFVPPPARTTHEEF